MERPVGLLQLLEGGQLLFLQVPLLTIFIVGGMLQSMSGDEVAGDVGEVS